MREQTWWLRAWTYARLQMLVICSLTAAVYVLVIGLDEPWDKLIWGCLILSALGCLRDIFPFTKLSHKQTPDLQKDEPHIPIRLLVGNVLMENKNFDQYLAQIKEVSADIVFLVETNDLWREKLKDLETNYAYHYALPLPDFNGMLFYSNFPLLNVDERYLVQDHIPSIKIDMDVGHTQPLSFYGAHPRPPRPEDDTANLDKELSLIAKEVGHLRAPVIVTGDLNDVGWSSTTKRFLRISGLLDPRHGRGLFNSYNAKNPIVRWPLDHVFHSKHFSLSRMERLKPCGSDHFPLLISLALHDPTS
jgi:endonuclease/exonuclease/phosphatase (EEP) superfamily protein YafD